MEKICTQIHCEPDCGENQGYKFIRGNILDPNYNFHWINPIVPNVSHDLRFANYIQTEILNFTSIPLIEKAYYEEEFGTPEDTFGDKTNIRNIFNLLDALESGINNFNVKKNHKKYADWTVVATMDVYDDGREYTFDVLPVP